MKDMDQRRKRQEEGGQDEKEDDVIDDEVAPTDVDEEDESEAGEAGEVVEVVEESMAEVVEAEGKEGLPSTITCLTLSGKSVNTSFFFLLSIMVDRNLFCNSLRLLAPSKFQTVLRPILI